MTRNLLLATFVAVIACRVAHGQPVDVAEVEPIPDVSLAAPNVAAEPYYNQTVDMEYDLSYSGVPPQKGLGFLGSCCDMMSPCALSLWDGYDPDICHYPCFLENLGCRMRSLRLGCGLGLRGCGACGSCDQCAFGQHNSQKSEEYCDAKSTSQKSHQKAKGLGYGGGSKGGCGWGQRSHQKVFGFQHHGGKVPTCAEYASKGRKGSLKPALQYKQATPIVPPKPAMQSAPASPPVVDPAPVPPINGAPVILDRAADYRDSMLPVFSRNRSADGRDMPQPSRFILSI